MRRSSMVAALVLAGWVLAGCNKTDTSAAETAAEAKGGGTQAPAASRPSPVTLPEGTSLPVRLTTAISTASHQTGDAFTATLEEPVMDAGREALPKGARVEGVVAESDPGGRVQGRASLSLRLTRVTLPGGGAVEVTTNTVGREARSTKKRDAAKVGIGAGVGAAVGAIAGGGRGAAIGAGVGAGAGTATVLATRGEPAAFPAESLVRFSLRAPVNLTGSR